MRVIEEPITVLRDAGEPGLTLLMGGYRVALTMDEARALVTTMRAALPAVPGESGEREPADAAERTPDHAAIVARVREQVISWSQIAEGTQRG